VIVSAQASAPSQKKNDESGTLRQYADQLNFRIGAGIRPKSWEADTKGREILAREFNSTIAMGMMGTTEPRAQGEFDFTNMDRTIAFAKKNDMKIWGAALIYRPDSLPRWMQDRMHSGPNPRQSFTVDQLDALMKQHIQTVIKHGGASFYAWGVVNEPLSHHNNPWELIMGQDEYIAKAFRYAREVTNLPLVLNETFLQAGIKKDRADEFFALVKRLKAQGVPIDAVGTETHLEVQQLDPDYLDQFKDFLRRARELGVAVYITEMDVYQGTPGSSKDPWDTQRRVYHDVAAACLADSNCKGMTIWDLSDKDNWLTGVKQKRQPYLQDAKPDLFDENNEKKPAYFGILQALKEASATKR
jgi:endo-1,4-beta-xylanase